MKRKLVLAALLAGSAFAATLPPQGTTPATRLYGAPGQPDISGIWVPKMQIRKGSRGTGFGSKAPIWGLDEPPLKGDYLKQFQTATKDADAGRPLADTASQCKALGVPRVLFGPDPTEIIQTPGQVTMIQETGHEVRRIYTDGRKQPDDPDPWFDGHSIGHWDGNSLVVDDVAMRPETALDAAETPHSDQLHVVERWTLTDPNTIEIDAVAYDPKAFTHPWKAHYVWGRADSDYEMIEDICEDNNRNVTLPDGTQGSTLENK